MRKIDSIILHCSDSDVDLHDSLEVIRSWHLENGWIDVGYHYFIDSLGGLFIGREIVVQGAHARGHNEYSIGICLSGRRFFSRDQFKTLAKLVRNLMDIFDIEESEVVGHNSLSMFKTCPNFSVDNFKRDYLMPCRD